MTRIKFLDDVYSKTAKLCFQWSIRQVLFVLNKLFELRKGIHSIRGLHMFETHKVQMCVNSGRKTVELTKQMN